MIGPPTLMGRPPPFCRMFTTYPNATPSFDGKTCERRRTLQHRRTLSAGLPNDCKGTQKMMMDGMGWMMGGMSLVWILILIVLVLAIIALVKYLKN